MSKQAAAWLPMIASTLYAPPAPVGASTAMLDLSREGREIWRNADEQPRSSLRYFRA
jgi:hypothetical protein